MSPGQSYAPNHQGHNQSHQPKPAPLDQSPPQPSNSRRRLFSVRIIRIVRLIRGIGQRAIDNDLLRIIDGSDIRDGAIAQHLGDGRIVRLVAAAGVVAAAVAVDGQRLVGAAGAVVVRVARAPRVRVRAVQPDAREEGQRGAGEEDGRDPARRPPA